MLVFSIFLGVAYAQLVCPTFCATVTAASCTKDQVFLPQDKTAGRCCDKCVPKPDCTTVRCGLPTCAAGETPLPPAPDQCCSTKCAPSKCANFACIALACDEATQITIPADPANGVCCPSCKPKTIDCALVKCALNVCDPATQVTIPADPANGRCCQTCKPKPDCSTVLCNKPICGANEVVVTVPGSCCATCAPSKCGDVACRALACDEATQITIPADPANGVCCPSCKPKPSDCTTVKCALNVCDPTTQVTIPADPANGRCCQTCKPKPDCSTVRCGLPTCAAGETPLPPAPDQCCSTKCAPSKCGDIACIALACNEKTQITIPADPANGVCCPSCKPRLDCAAVLCNKPICGANEIVVTLPGSCCPTCQAMTPTKCDLIACDARACDETTEIMVPADPTNGVCCSSCAPKKPICPAVLCQKLLCRENERLVTLPGTCCPTCKPATPTKCDLIACDARACDETTQITVPADPANGVCCSSCVPKKDDCAAVKCASPNCGTNQKILPPAPGKCCSTCSEDLCASLTCERCLTSRVANWDACCGKCSTDNCPAIKCLFATPPKGCTRVEGTKCPSCALTCVAQVVVKAASDADVTKALGDLASKQGAETTVTKGSDGTFKVTVSSDVDEMKASSFGADATADLARASGIMSAQLDAVAETLARTDATSSASLRALAVALVSLALVVAL